MSQLLFPEHELRVTGAKCEHGVRQRAAVDHARMNAHQHGAVVTALDVPGMEVLHDGLCSRFQVGGLCRARFGTRLEPGTLATGGKAPNCAENLQEILG